MKKCLICLSAFAFLTSLAAAPALAVDGIPGASAFAAANKADEVHAKDKDKEKRSKKNKNDDKDHNHHDGNAGSGNDSKVK